MQRWNRAALSAPTLNTAFSYNPQSLADSWSHACLYIAVTSMCIPSVPNIQPVNGMNGIDTLSHPAADPLLRLIQCLHYSACNTVLAIPFLALFRHRVPTCGCCMQLRLRVDPGSPIISMSRSYGGQACQAQALSHRCAASHALCSPHVAIACKGIQTRAPWHALLVVTAASCRASSSA